MRRLNSLFEIEYISESGFEKNNRTFFAYMPLEDYSCYVLAESFDSDEDVNSAKLAVEAVMSAFEEKPSIKKGRIKQYLNFANEQLIKNSVKSKLMVGITVVVSDYTRIRYAVCGNVKLHMFNQGLIELVSEPQVYNVNRYNDGLQANQSENEDFDSYGMVNSNREIQNLLQYLGKVNGLEPFISKKIKLKENTTLLLTSCNVWERLSDVELLEAVDKTKTTVEAIENVQDLLLSTNAQKKITSYGIVVIEVVKTFMEDDSKKKKRLKLLYTVLTVLLIMLLITAISVGIMRVNDKADLTKIKNLQNEGISYSTYGNYTKALTKYEEAKKLSDKLNLKNFQYIKVKNELMKDVNEGVTLFTSIKDGDGLIEGKKYEQAIKTYKSVLTESAGNPELLLTDMAEDKVEMLERLIEINNLMAVGEMYDSSNLYASALVTYNEALKLAKETKDSDLRKEIQLKIYDINQKLNTKALEEVADAKAKEDEETQKVLDEKLSKIQEVTLAAVKAQKDGENEEAIKYYEEVLKLYEDAGIKNERVEEVYVKMAEVEKIIEEEETKLLEEEAMLRAEEEQEYNEKFYRIKDLIKLIDIAESDNQKKEALEYYNELLELYVDIDASKDRIESTSKKIEELKEEIEELDKIKKNREEKLLQVEELKIRALKEQKDKKNEEAIKTYEEILRIFEELKVVGSDVEDIYSKISVLEGKIGAGS